MKSNNLGNSRPFGMRVPSWRSSSKNGCTIDSMAVNRAEGVYSNNLDTISMASAGVRGRNTCEHHHLKSVSATQTASQSRNRLWLHEINLTHLVEWMRFNLRELVLHVIRVHRLDLISRRCSQNLDNFHKLINATLSWEERLTEHEFRHHTTSRPNVYN